MDPGESGSFDCFWAWGINYKKQFSVMKKIILLALMTAALAGAAVQKASAGVVVGASIGVPVAPGYCAPAYYPGYSNYSYPRPAYYGYGYNYNYCPPPVAYVRPPVVYGPSFYVAPPVFRFGFGFGGHGHFNHFSHHHFSHHGHW